MACERRLRSDTLFIIPSDCAPSRGFRGRDRASSPPSATSGERPGTQPKPLRSPRCWLGYVRSETEEPAHRDRAGIRRSPLRTALDIRSPGGGARDPGVVLPSAYAVITRSAKDGEGGDGDPAGDPDRP